MLNVKVKDKIRNTIIRQRTRMTDVVQYVTNAKWKWAGHIARVEDNRWTISSSEWQIRAYDQLEDQHVVGEMTLWGNRERYGQG